MSPRAYSPLAEFARSSARIFDMFRSVTEIIRPVAESVRSVIKIMGSPAEVMRPIVERARAAEETEEALAALPKRTLRHLTTKDVRCPGNEQLLQVVRIPAHLPGAAYDTHLVMPKSGVTYRLPDKRLPAKRAWFLGEENTFDVRCHCHPGLTLTMDQLRGESPRPPEIRVLES